jgi:ribosomal protein S27AE
MTSKRKDELFEKLAGVANDTDIDTRVLEILTTILYEIHTSEDTLPKYCPDCGHMVFFDPLKGQYICKRCTKKR